MIEVNWVPNNHEYPDERPSRDEVYLAVAEAISLRGTCKRGKVGCIITQDHRIVATGYNGPVLNHICNDLNCDLEHACTNAIHAEANAIAFAARHGVVLNGSTMYCRTQPCLKCAELIIQSGICKVIYTHLYRDDLGYNLLIAAGIKAEKI